MKRIDALFVLLDVGLTLDNSAVFQSQFLDQAIALNKMGFRVAVICHYGDLRKFDTLIGDRTKENDIDVFSFSDAGFLSNLTRMVLLLRQIKKEYQVNHAYVRSIWGGVALLLSSPMKRFKYVYDVRGDVVDEAIAVGNNKLKVTIYEMLERLGVKYAENVSAVTTKLSDSIAKRVNMNNRPYVVPSCIDVDAISVDERIVLEHREKLGYSIDDVVLVYSGGLSHYQKVPEMIELWREIFESDPRVHFLLITNSSPHSLPPSIGDLDCFGSRLKCMSLSRSDLFRVLSCADIGFLLRDSRELNKAASPVKFAEYIASGLAIVTSPTIGDLSGYVTESSVGVLIKPLVDSRDISLVCEFIDAVRKDRDLYRKRSYALAKEKYDWSSYRDVYNKWYQ